MTNVNIEAIFTVAKAYFLNLQSSSRAFKVGEVHYDLGNDFGIDYDKTLMAWFHNFDTAWSASASLLRDKPVLRAKYGDRFYRMWKFYLLSCAGCFRSRNIHLWQIVLSKKGVPTGYTSLR